jgi:hypothetical protein
MLPGGWTGGVAQSTPHEVHGVVACAHPTSPLRGASGGGRGRRHGGPRRLGPTNLARVALQPQRHNSNDNNEEAAQHTTG